MRSAFLVGFATSGYLYTFQPAFGLLLDQFRSPDERLIDPLPIFFEDDAPLERREDLPTPPPERSRPDGTGAGLSPVRVGR